MKRKPRQLEVVSSTRSDKRSWPWLACKVAILSKGQRYRTPVACFKKEADAVAFVVDAAKVPALKVPKDLEAPQACDRCFEIHHSSQPGDDIPEPEHSETGKDLYGDPLCSRCQKTITEGHEPWCGYDHMVGQM